jgi:hypothetical protein
MSTTNTTRRRDFFKKIAAAAATAVAAGGVVPKMLRSAERNVEKPVKVSTHPMAVARKRTEEKA